MACLAGTFSLVFFGVFILIALAGTVFWIYAIIDCAQNEPSAGNDKVVWLLVIVFLHLVGALVYWLVRRPQRIRELGK